MVYTDEQIMKALDKLELTNPVFFVGLLPSFIWCRNQQTVVDYATSPNPYNDLQVLQTEIVEADKLDTYFKELELHEKDVLVFCVNQQYFPVDKKKKFLRIKIIKKAAL
jgi:hypothetical protein